MEQTALYCAHMALWLAAIWRAGGSVSVLVLAVNLSGSWIIGEATTGYDRAVAMILLDLGTILALRAWGEGARDRLVAALALAMIFWRSTYMAAPYINQWTYAATINCAVALQLIVCGGLADGLGRSVDSWLSRVWPRGARALRHVAT